HPRGRNGDLRTALLSLRRIASPTDGIAGSLRDVTEWVGSLQYYRAMTMSMTEGALLVAADGNFLVTNPSADRILGITHDEAAGTSSVDPKWRTIREDGSEFPVEDYPVSIALRDGVASTNVVMGFEKRSDESAGWIRINATPLFRGGHSAPYAATVTFTDITAERALEAQFLQSQKLESVGQLAGGIAHDFNNMLTVIFNRCDLLKRLVADPLLLGYVNDIARAAQQSANVTQQLLAVARKQVLKPKIIDPAQVIHDLAGLMIKTIGEHITVQMKVADALWRVYADAV